MSETINLDELFAEQVDEAALAETQASLSTGGGPIPAGTYDIVAVDRAEARIVPDVSPRTGEPMRNGGRKYLDFFLTLGTQPKARKVGAQASWQVVKIQGANGEFADRESKNYATLAKVYGKTQPADVLQAFQGAPEMLRALVAVNGERNYVTFVPARRG